MDENLNLERLTALAELIVACKKEDIVIRDVEYRGIFKGFIVRFEDWEGDAALHDGTYGRFDNTWETYQFPWDYGDVSVHDTEHLVKMLSALKNNENWSLCNE